MTTMREQVLLALHAALATLGGVNVTRNEPLIDFQLPATAIADLDDGKLEQTDAFFNGGDGTVYEFTATPVVMVAVNGGTAADRDAQVDAMLVDLQDRLAAALESGLGGLVTDIRPQPADYMPENFFGTADSKAATVGIELDFWSTSSLG